MISTHLNWNAEEKQAASEEIRNTTGPISNLNSKLNSTFSTLFTSVLLHIYQFNLNSWKKIEAG